MPSKLDLAQMIEVPAVQSLMDDFYPFARLPMAIIDLKGKVLVGVGWQEICTKFHRIHPETCRHCIESDTLLSAGVSPGEFKLYKCKNHMWDVATPIVVGGQHVGNLFSGQFFFCDEAVDRELFRSQASHYGFDESEYLAALDRVPRVSREALNTAMRYFSKLAMLLSRVGYTNFQLVSSLVERSRKEQELRGLNRTLQALSQSNQAILRARDEAQFLNEVCRIIVQDCGHAMVWIGYADQDPACTVRPVAYAGFEEGYLETLNLTWADTERGRGPTGTAIRTGKPTRCANILTDPQFAPWREQALKRGYASSLVLPLLTAGKAFGAITIYSTQPDPFSNEEVDLLTRLADDLVYGLEAIRLREERTRAQDALEETAEDLRRSNSDLEQFAYVASHDLQEPLRAVSGFVKLLQRRCQDKLDAKATEWISGAIEGAARMEQLILDLLAYSRVGTQSDGLVPMNLDVAVDTALKNLKTSIQAAGASVTRDPLPEIRADPTQMVQLFQNLIGNAIKFRGNDTPKIHIRAEHTNEKWTLSVQDNGIGIDPQYSERIFHIFQRLHTRKHYPGTGIGLAICKKIVDRHGGRIWVQSQPGRGATFYFDIPELPEAASHELTRRQAG